MLIIWDMQDVLWLKLQSCYIQVRVIHQVDIQVMSNKPSLKAVSSKIYNFR